MDLLDDYLSGVRARGAVFCSTVSVPPWGMRFTEPAPLTLSAMLRGDAWLVPDTGDPVELPRGGIALVRARSPYTVADRPGSRPLVLVDGDDRCTLVGDPAEPGRNWRVTGRTVGDAADSATDLLVTAGYRVGSDLCRPLLDALPPIAIVRPDPGLSALLDLIAAEVEHDEPGQQVVLDRFLDLLLVRALRTWFAHPGATPPPRATVPSPIRTSGTSCAGCTRSPPGRGRSPRSRTRPACPGPRSPAASRRWSADHP
uniref:cupin domain-containing protein n=1 Tax=Streptomyces roseoverticillatus TaxID=66429 RepID=UPI001F1D7F8C|nr:cupin domain-containing protein [Streptomyces roseoverticillatus]